MGELNTVGYLKNQHLNQSPFLKQLFTKNDTVYGMRANDRLPSDALMRPKYEKPEKVIQVEHWALSMSKHAKQSSLDPSRLS